ncbi:MAG: nitrogen fixation protein NifH [Candidatus Lokiarchaeia archaeon]
MEIDQSVLDWLTERSNPSVRYFTLKNLLGKSENSSEVREAKELNMSEGVIPSILSHQNEEGHFPSREVVEKYSKRPLKSGGKLLYGKDVERFGYLPKYKATIWQLLLFAELGADGDDPRIRKTCEYVLKTTYSENGLFTILGDNMLAPCFHGNMTYSLLKLGYTDDPRLEKALQILFNYQRFDDGDFKTPKEWPYRGRRDRCSGNHSCYAGCAKGLKAVTAYPKKKWNNKVKEYIKRGSEFFLKHRIYKSSHKPTKLLRKGIDEVTFPNFIYSDFLEILDMHLELGVKDSRMKDAVELLKSKQLGNGRWKLDRDVSNLHTIIERKGKESKWATYRALNALKKWEES